MGMTKRWMEKQKDAIPTRAVAVKNENVPASFPTRDEGTQGARLNNEDRKLKKQRSRKKREGLKKQALTVAASGGLVRALGFALRLLLASLLSAGALGVSELAASVYMLALTPVVAGFPAAVSRMTALEKGDETGGALQCARSLALKVSLPLFAAFVLCSPLIARTLGDERTLYALLTFSPCIPILALSCATDGYLFGVGDVHPPARSDLLEQAVRIGVCALVLGLTPAAPLAFRAAVPALAMTVGEGAGLIYLMAKTKTPRIKMPRRRRRLVNRELLFLSVPLTLSRLVSGALRTAGSLLIPLRLEASGLSYPEGVTSLGLFSGMGLPLLMLPAMFSGAIGTVGTPAIARLRKEDAPGFIRRLLYPACALGALSALLLYFAAPFISRKLFRQPALTALYRALCPLCLTGSVQAVIAGIFSGLGLQKKAFFCNTLGAALTLALTYALTARPALRLMGAGLSMIAGQALTIALSLVLIVYSMRSSSQVAPSVEK